MRDTEKQVFYEQNYRIERIIEDRIVAKEFVNMLIKKMYALSRIISLLF